MTFGRLLQKIKYTKYKTPAEIIKIFLEKFEM